MLPSEVLRPMYFGFTLVTSKGPLPYFLINDVASVSKVVKSPTLKVSTFFTWFHRGKT